jgi:hypothetical protein
MQNQIPEIEELLKKQLDVTLEEILLVQKRLDLMKTQLNDLPNFHPLYFDIDRQIHLDQIFLDELIRKQDDLEEQLEAMA